MVAIQIKGVPEDIHDALKKRSSEHRQPMSEYVLNLIRRDLARPSRQDWLDELGTHSPFDSTEAIQALREIREQHERDLNNRN